jgi:hypothetical protein
VTLRLRAMLLAVTAISLLAAVFWAVGLASSEEPQDKSEISTAFTACMSRAGYTATTDGWQLPDGTIVVTRTTQPIRGTDEVRALFATNEACQEAVGLAGPDEVAIAEGNARIDAYYRCMGRAGWPVPERLVGVDGRVTYRGGDTSAPGWAEDSRLCLASSSAR